MFVANVLALIFLMNLNLG